MRIEFGYRAEAEGHQPDDLLKYAALAQRVGFDFIPISDHFQPWFDTNAASAFAWSWISAAAATIPNVRFGTIVTAPIGRYHPAVVAQAFATMDAMFPNRIFIALGTGEAMNDSPLGYRWPKFPERLARIKESLEIIQQLWTGELVNYSGQYYTLEDARLYTKPKSKIPILVAANGSHAAVLAGRYGDGYATVDPFMDNIKTLWPIIQQTAKEAGRDPSGFRKNVELFFSYSSDYDAALASARKWKSVLIPNILNLPVADPRELEKRGNEIPDEELEKSWTITTNPEDVIKKAERAIALGYNEIELHSSSPSEEEFINMCGEEVLPHLKNVHS